MYVYPCVCIHVKGLQGLMLAYKTVVHKQTVQYVVEIQEEFKFASGKSWLGVCCFKGDIGIN